MILSILTAQSHHNTELLQKRGKVVYKRAVSAPPHLFFSLIVYYIFYGSYKNFLGIVILMGSPNKIEE